MNSPQGMLCYTAVIKGTLGAAPVAQGYRLRLATQELWAPSPVGG